MRTWKIDFFYFGDHSNNKLGDPFPGMSRINLFRYFFYDPPYEIILIPLEGYVNKWNKNVDERHSFSYFLNHQNSVFEILPSSSSIFIGDQCFSEIYKMNDYDGRNKI